MSQSSNEFLQLGDKCGRRGNCHRTIGRCEQATAEARDVLKQARRLSQERDYEDHFEQAETLLQTLNAGT